MIIVKSSYNLSTGHTMIRGQIWARVRRLVGITLATMCHITYYFSTLDPRTRLIKEANFPSNIGTSSEQEFSGQVFGLKLMGSNRKLKNLCIPNNLVSKTIFNSIIFALNILLPRNVTIFKI